LNLPSGKTESSKNKIETSKKIVGRSVSVANSTNNITNKITNKKIDLDLQIKTYNIKDE